MEPKKAPFCICKWQTRVIAWECLLCNSFYNKISCGGIVQNPASARHCLGSGCPAYRVSLHPRSLRICIKRCERSETHYDRSNSHGSRRAVTGFPANRHAQRQKGRQSPIQPCRPFHILSVSSSVRTASYLSLQMILPLLRS